MLRFWNLKTELSFQLKSSFARCIITPFFICRRLILSGFTHSMKEGAIQFD